MFALQSTPYPSSPEVSSCHMKARQCVGGLVSITLFHLTTIGSRGGRESIHYVPSNEKRAVTVIVVVVVCLFVCYLFCFVF